MAAFVTILLLIGPQWPLQPTDAPVVIREPEKRPPVIAFDAPPRSYPPLIRR
jgi:hypothetical protein